MDVKASLFGFLVLMGLGFGGMASAQHQHHAKHGMFLYGDEAVYASHIVYKVPHNYQVILRVRFDAEALAVYRQARVNFPQDQLVFVLDAMDLAQIDVATSVTGTLAHDDESGRSPIKAGIRLERKDFDLLFFSELPLSLE